MGRSTALTRGHAFPILLAGMIGYLVGGWHPTALQSQGLSAAQSIALRFPEQLDRPAPAPVAADPNVAPPAGVLDTPPPAAAVRADDAQFALLDPEPMVPPAVHPAPSQAATQSPAPEARVQLASAEIAVKPPAVGTAEPIRISKTSVAAAPRINRATPPRRAVMNRPGYMLDDAQIASIKERLHLTPEQEQMWPAVEAALRNIAYTRAQEARRRGVSGDDAVQTAGIDPQSVEGLKSAAVPLIMSFDEEQKQEVRDLAHVMGLDQLASEF